MCVNVDEIPECDVKAVNEDSSSPVAFLNILQKRILGITLFTFWQFFEAEVFSAILFHTS